MMEKMELLLLGCVEGYDSQVFERDTVFEREGRLETTVIRRTITTITTTDSEDDDTNNNNNSNNSNNSNNNQENHTGKAEVEVVVVCRPKSL
jgi:hypothetical protein